MDRDDLDVTRSQAAMHIETPLQWVVYDISIFESINVGMSI